MLRTLAFVAAITLAAGAASAQTIDKNGKCHDASGKMAKMEVCKPPAAAATASAGAKKCVKGKACGNTCISVKDTCHK
jgi:hypothetical protein